MVGKPCGEHTCPQMSQLENAPSSPPLRQTKHLSPAALNTPSGQHTNTRQTHAQCQCSHRVVTVCDVRTAACTTASAAACVRVSDRSHNATKNMSSCCCVVNGASFAVPEVSAMARLPPCSEILPCIAPDGLLVTSLGSSIMTVAPRINPPPHAKPAAHATIR